MLGKMYFLSVFTMTKMNAKVNVFALSKHPAHMFIDYNFIQFGASKGVGDRGLGAATP